MADVTTPLIVREGEKAAPAADAAGVPCVGLPGVWSWVEGERLVLLDDLAGPVGNDVLDAALTSDL